MSTAEDDPTSAMALSRCRKKNARILRLERFQATATAVRRVSIADARKMLAGSRVHYLIDLGDDDASLESGRFDDGGGVLRVRTHVQIALTVGVTGHGQRNMGREVDEVLISP
jgi:hypothetical protein